MNIPHNIGAPSGLKMMAEARAPFESLSLLFHDRYLKSVPKGNGQPVLVLPGLGTNDVATLPLRNFLARIGYTPYGWGIGLNVGYKPEHEDRLILKVRKLYLKHHEPVRLIGWSMGGIYAREIAKIEHHAVSQVITMGSPFSGGKSQKTNVNILYRLLNGHRIREVHDSRANYMTAPPPVPTTAIYSKSDGIVAWQYCMEYANAPHLESIEIRGSHVGMGVNSMVWMILADRLAQKMNNWQPFNQDALGSLYSPWLV